MTVTQTTTRTVTTSKVGPSRREITQPANNTIAFPSLMVMEPTVHDTSSPALTTITITETSIAPSTNVTTTVATTQLFVVDATVVITNTVVTITEPLIATTTVIRTVASTTELVEKTVFVLPLRMAQLGQIIRGDVTKWTYMDGAPSGDSEALLAIYGETESTSDIFGWREEVQPITLLRSNGHPSAVGSVLYYDPVNALYGPDSSGVNLTPSYISFIVAVPSTDPNAALTRPLRCAIAPDGRLSCPWDEGESGSWWQCGNRLAISHPEYRPPRSICATSSEIRPLKWSDVVQ